MGELSNVCDIADELRRTSNNCGKGTTVQTSIYIATQFLISVTSIIVVISHPSQNIQQQHDISIIYVDESKKESRPSKSSPIKS